MEEQNTIHLKFKTKELNFFQKLLQVYWANPKSWLLDEFVIENETVTIRTLKGNFITAPIMDMKIRCQTDNYDRRECYVSYNGERLHFKEIPGMLEDKEWNQLFEILYAVPDTGLTKLGWFTKIAKVLINVAKNI